MKNIIYAFISLFLLFATACQDEEVEPQTLDTNVLEVNIQNGISRNSVQEIELTIQKPTPCHEVTEVNQTNAGTTFNYDITLEQISEVCATVVAEEVVLLTFEPQATGEHTLNFFINGHLYATKKVEVTN